MEAINPELDAMGWSAGARGHYQLSRDGVALAGAGLASRSRGGFGFDETLGTLGSEVVQAIAAHIGHVVVTVPEPSPERFVVLPPVVTRDAFIVSQVPKGYSR